MPQAQPTHQRIDASDALRLDAAIALPLARRYMRLDSVIATIHDHTPGERRLDAGETLMLARQLIFLRAKVLERDYAILKARTLFPVATDVSNGADSFSVKEYDSTGTAKRISNFSDDLPRADAFVTETLRSLYTYANSFGYSVQELRAAAMAGAELESKRMKAARDAFDRKVEEIAAFGDADAGVSGVLNAANIQLVTMAAAGAWSAKSGDEIIADVSKLLKSIPTTTKGNNIATHCVLGLDGWQTLATKARSTTSDLTLLEFLKKAFPGVTFDWWSKCDLADAEGDGPRIMAYQKDDMVAELVISQDFEMLPPQERNLGFVVPCMGRVGGFAVHKPKAIAVMDGTAG